MSGISGGSRTWSRVRFALSWVVAVLLLGVGVPRTVDISWHGLVPVLESVHWPALLVLVMLPGPLARWVLGTECSSTSREHTKRPNPTQPRGESQRLGERKGR